MEGNFKGVVLISPWVSFSTDYDSFKRNEFKDCITTTAVKRWSSAWLAGEKTDFYNQAVMAPKEWWVGLRVEEVLVVAGKEESLLDGIVEFVGKLKGGLGSKVEVVVVEGEYHDQNNLDLQLGVKAENEGEQSKLIKRWVSSKL